MQREPQTLRGYPTRKIIWTRSLLRLLSPCVRGRGIPRLVVAPDAAREHPRAVEAQCRRSALIAQVLRQKACIASLRCGVSGANSLDSKRPRHIGAPGSAKPRSGAREAPAATLPDPRRPAPSLRPEASPEDNPLRV